MSKISKLLLGFTAVSILIGGFSPAVQSQTLAVVTLETNVAPEIFHTSLPAIPADEGVRIAMDRTQTRPGERWLRGQVKLAPSLANGTILRASVLGVPGDKVLGVTEKPATVLNKVRANVRSASGNKSRLRVEVLRGAQVVGVDEVTLSEPGIAQVADNTRIPVSVDVDAARISGSIGTTFGVPFAAGALWDASRLAVLDGKGAAVPAQITTSALWYPDGSVKWARVDVAAPAGGELFVQVGNSPQRSAPSMPISVTEAGGAVTVRIGATEYSLGGAGSPIRTLSQGGTVVATSEGARGLYVVDQTGRVGTASAKDSKITIESRGPVEATVRIEGPYLAPDGQELARHSTRVQFFANQPQARISHTFLITQDTNKIWFKEIGWELKSGANATSAIFNTSTDWKQSTPVALAAGESASMAQTEHFRFLQGENKFALTKTSGAQNTAVTAGAESGDWAALTGATGGFLFGTREAARRHPKEFLATASTLDVLLFSPKGGNELDFRSPQVARDIGLENLIKKVEPRTDAAASIRKFSAVPSDASGWAKTHELVLSPVAPGQGVAEYAKPAALMSQPAQALASPQWLYQTRVLGSLHPYDPKTFPEVEDYSARGIAALDKFGDDFGEFGFRNYEGGPHFVQTFSPPHPLLKRWSLSYSVRSHLWYAYARRGQRSVRDFAEGSARAFHDNYMANWDGAKKTRGLFVSPAGTDGGGPDNHNSLPVPWGEESVTEISGTSDLDMFLLDYYLTGNSRAADAVRDYGEGMKKVWKPGSRTWRHLRLLYNVTQAYTLNWDEQLGDLARATAHYIADEEAGLGLLTSKPLSTSYKTQSDFLIAPYIAEVLGDRRYVAMADKLADYWRDSYIENPIRYGNPDAYVAEYLYEKDADPMVAENMATKLRQMAETSRRHPKTVPPLGVHATNFWMHGFAIAQHIVKDSGALEKNIASQANLEIFGAAPKWYVKKDANQNVKVRFSYSGRSDAGREAETVGGELSLRPVGFANRYGQDLNRVTNLVDGAIVELAKDAPAGVYEINGAREGSFGVMADAPVPLMMAAPGPWQPIPVQHPMPPVYFQIGAGDKDPKLILAGRARLTAPGGTAFGGGQWQSGEVSLGAKPGVWKLELEKQSVVRASGFAPLFAYDSPANVFTLPEGEEVTEAEAPFAAPVGGIRIKPEEKITIAMPETELKAGTIEFYFRPTKSPDESDSNWRLVNIENSAARDAVVNYMAAPQGEVPGYQLTTFVPVANPANARGTSGVRGRRRHFFEGGRWNHIAFVWGIAKADYRKLPTTTTLVTVDGQVGPHYAGQMLSSTPNIKTSSITIGPGLDGTIAGVRLSGTARYMRDFEPPVIGKAAWKDANTLAAWPLEGNLASESTQGAFALAKTTAAPAAAQGGEKPAP